MLHNQPPAPSTIRPTPNLRRDSIRPRLDSTISNEPNNPTIPNSAAITTLTKALNLLLLTLAALQKTGETPVQARTPERRAAISRLVVFARDAWDEETFNAELERAKSEVPTLGVEMCVGMWMGSAVQILREGGLEKDAADLSKACEGLRGSAAGPTGERRRVGEGLGPERRV